MGNFGPGNVKFIKLKVEVEHVFQTIAFLFTESTVGEESLQKTVQAPNFEAFPEKNNTTQIKIHLVQ